MKWWLKLSQKISKITRTARDISMSFLGLTSVSGENGTQTINFDSIYHSSIVFVIGLPIGMLLFPNYFSMSGWLLIILVTLILSNLDKAALFIANKKDYSS